jgi:hypothetical protein
MSSIYDLGDLWPNANCTINTHKIYNPFPASNPKEERGRIHTAEVISIAEMFDADLRPRLDIVIENGLYCDRLFFNLEGPRVSGLLPPSEAQRAHRDEMQKLRRLRSAATALGLATKTGVDLSPEKLQEAVGKVLLVAVKYSGKTRKGKFGEILPRPFYYVLGLAPSLEPISDEIPVSEPMDDDDIPF